MEIKTLIEFNKLLDPHIARLLMGEAGIGKSSFVKMIAKQQEARLIDLRLSELEPADLVGLPYIENGVTKFARPEWWPTDPEERVCLLLDEVDRCREDMHPVAMQLTLDRRAGGRDLHDNVEVWAACNGENYLTMPIDQALMDRFVAIELTPSVEEWIEWAKENDVHRSVIDFISTDKSKLDTPEKLIGKPNVVAPSRRSWARLGKMLNKIDDLLAEEYLGQYMAAFIGYECSAAFSSWIEENYVVVTPGEIFAGIANAKNLNIVQVAVCAEEAAAEFLDKNKTREQQYNCLKFYMDAGYEAFATFFEALDPAAALIMAEFPDVDGFITDSKNELFRHVGME